MVRAICDRSFRREPPSPFIHVRTSNCARDLRLTIHCPEPVPPDDLPAVSLIRELARLPGISAVDTITGRLPRLTVLSEDGGAHWAVLNHPDGRVVRDRWEESLQFRQPLALQKVLEGVGRVTHDLEPEQLGRVLAVGVSYPGLLDPQGCLSAVNLGWTKVPLLASLREAFPWPVFLERDKGTCIHAESWLGAAQDHGNALFLIAEGGIGLGVLAAGHQLTGARSFSGEIGHCKFVAGAEDLCNCGQRGCLEAIASGVNIVRQYAERTGTAQGALRFADVLERARLGDGVALSVFDRAGRAIGSALSTAISLLDPEIVILGGDLIAAEDVMLPIIWDQIRIQTRPRSLEVVEIVVSGLGLDIRLRGAASLAFRNMLESPERVRRMCDAGRGAVAG